MPDAAVIIAMRQFKAALLRGERAQMREMATRWLAVERRLTGQMDALAQAMATIAAEGGTVGTGLLFNDVRYRTLLIQLTSELERYSGYAERTIEARQRQLARLGIQHAAEAITAQGIGAGFARLPVEAVETMVGLAGNGSPLRTLLVATWPDAADGLTQALVNGVALGYNPRRIAREMARGATGSLNRMLNMARTETMRVYKTANLESYKASGVVTSYLRLATHDSRVCPLCLLLEGTEYPLDRMMPSHPSCRCTLVPKVQGVPAPRWTKGETWLREQPAATQRSILGKGRYEAWQDGAFDLQDVVSVVSNAIWGDTLRAVPLRELTGA